LGRLSKCKGKKEDATKREGQAKNAKKQGTGKRAFNHVKEGKAGAYKGRREMLRNEPKFRRGKKR